MELKKISKPASVKIINIVNVERNIIGLGDYSFVYMWLTGSQSWEVYGVVDDNSAHVNY
jgi:hypothetical protein